MYNYRYGDGYNNPRPPTCPPPAPPPPPAGGGNQRTAISMPPPVMAVIPRVASGNTYPVTYQPPYFNTSVPPPVPYVNTSIPPPVVHTRPLPPMSTPPPPITRPTRNYFNQPVQSKGFRQEYQVSRSTSVAESRYVKDSRDTSRQRRGDSKDSRNVRESRGRNRSPESGYRSESKRHRDDRDRRSRSRDREHRDRRYSRERHLSSKRRSKSHDRSRYSHRMSTTRRSRSLERRSRVTDRSVTRDTRPSVSRGKRKRSPSKDMRSVGKNVQNSNGSRDRVRGSGNQVTDKISSTEGGLANTATDKPDSGDKDDHISDTEDTVQRWYRSSPADLYYGPMEGRKNVMMSTAKGKRLIDMVKKKLIERGKRCRPSPEVENVPPPRCQKLKMCKHKSEVHSGSSDCSTESASESDNDKVDHALQELQRKQRHPRRLHSELWYNDPGEMNDGPLCRCSARTRKQGIRHGIYAGEVRTTPCDPNSNNIDKLYHYRISISPPTNFLIKTLTVITYDGHEFLFSGFSLLSHTKLEQLPPCKVIRFNIEYTISYSEEQAPLNFTIEELDVFEEFLFKEILELVDLDMGTRDSEGCSQFHLLPRWEREVEDDGGEVLSICEVFQHLLRAGVELIPEVSLKPLRCANERDWQSFVDEVRGMIVTYPGKKPCSLRVDQLDRSLSEEDQRKWQDSSSALDQQKLQASLYPEIVHFGIRPPQLSYAGNFEYKKAWRDYVKFRHLVANMAKPTFQEKRKLERKEELLQEMRTQSKMKRDVTVAVPAKGFYRTGLMCDVVQHAMLVPVLIGHLRFHKSLSTLEETIEYKFKNRAFLQLALTHPSYRENYGTNRDHARNTLTNCGIRQPEYGDRRIHYMNIRKRGINTLINIMSRFGKKSETESAINHNERLEFLGDAVVEFVSSIHLFKMFPHLEEGGLATYRAAIVQNQHLALLAMKIGLEKYMLYAHGSDLCHDLELRHAMANCFEALMGALLLDGGIEVADRVFALALWKDSPTHHKVWMKPRLHILQEQEPLGDRMWIPKYPFLQRLTEFEDSIGVRYKHIRLLARAFTDRSMGFTNLTLGSNQRLEFLGDTVLQLISSEYLYKHFPEHHEGHLSLLRSSLVNNRTQAIVCDDLAMTNYAVYHNPKAELKTKDKADLLEAFLGSLYIEKSLLACLTFCNVCLFPRLQEFIMNQEWNDPKSKLQQCCLTLRTMDGSEPDIPVYKVIECVGPTNTRVYTVAVYFRGERLASAKGHYIQEAEMNAARAAIANSHNLFPQLDHQKRVIAKKLKYQRKRMKRDMLRESVMRTKGFRKSDKSGMDWHDTRRAGASKKDEKSKSKAVLTTRRIDNLPKAYLPSNMRSDNSDDSDNSSELGGCKSVKKSVSNWTDSDEDDGVQEVTEGEPIPSTSGTAKTKYLSPGEVSSGEGDSD